MSNTTPGHVTTAHVQAHQSKYNVHFPEHGTRQDDKYYHLFEAFRKKYKNDPEVWKCAVGKRRGDFSECTSDKPLEIHHHHIEWSFLNEVDIDMAHRQYPEIHDHESLDKWLESEANFMILCQWHHRGHGGVHVATSADFEGQHFVKHLID